MNTQHIPAEHWNSFLNDFSRAYAGWAATIEILQEKSGPQRAAAGLAFEGISFDTKGTRSASIEIALGTDRAHLAHVVDLPLNIRQVVDHQGNVHLQIEPAMGAPTLLHLRAPLH